MRPRGALFHSLTAGKDQRIISWTSSHLTDEGGRVQTPRSLAVGVSAETGTLRWEWQAVPVNVCGILSGGNS